VEGNRKTIFVHPMMAYAGSRGIPPLILNLWVVCFTSQPLCLLGKRPGTHQTGGSVEKRKICFPRRDWNPVLCGSTTLVRLRDASASCEVSLCVFVRYIVANVDTSDCTNPDIAPLFIHRSLWRYVEILYNGELLFVDFRGAEWGWRYIGGLTVLQMLACL
jgi:hypothetical protein